MPDYNCRRPTGSGAPRQQGLFSMVKVAPPLGVPAADHKPETHRGRGPLRDKLHELYHGQTPGAVRFRLGVIALDLAIIAFFVGAPLLRNQLTFLVVDYIIAVVVLVDMGARALAAPRLIDWLKRPGFWVDVVVLTTLLFPLWLSNFAFLRVMRLWTLFHSDFFWETVARRYEDSRWVDTTKALATLVTYLFIVTGLVYALYVGRHPGLEGYIDALYFTVTTVSTTGYGDITLPGPWGKLLAVFIMISGITLFVRLAQALSRPQKVRFQCPTCGLLRHDIDAVHCKACGTLVNIPNDEI
jgi:voltage-gated potassium channel